MALDVATTDAAIGYTVLFSFLALAGVLTMYLGAGEPMAGWGFALAMTAGAIAVAAPHIAGTY